MGLHFRFSLPARVYLSFLVFFHLIISVRLECKGFGLRNLNPDINNEWKFYNIPGIAQFDCFLCALWEEGGISTFELALPCRKDMAFLTDVKMNVFYLGSNQPALQLFTSSNPCESQYMSASNITGPVSSFSMTQDRTNFMLDFHAPAYAIRVKGTYEENTIVCIENVEYNFTVASSTTIASTRHTTSPPANRVSTLASSVAATGGREPETTRVLSRIITTNVKRDTTDVSPGILEVTTLASSVATTGGIESEIPKMFSRIITKNVKRDTTDVSPGILEETRQDFSIIWILLAVVLIATFFGVTFLCRSYFLSRGKRGGEVPEIYLSHSGSAVNGTVSHEPDMHRHTEPTTNHATTALSSENEYHTVGDTGDFSVDRNERTQQTSSNDNGTYESIPINRLMQNNYRVPEGEQLIDQSTHPDGNKSRRERKIDIGTPVVPSRSLGGAETTLKDVKEHLKMSKLRTNSEKVNTNVDNSIGQIGSDLNTKLPAKMPTRATVKHQTVKGHRDKDTVDHYAKSFNDGVNSRQDDEYSEVMDTVKRTSTTVYNELDNDSTASPQVKVKFVVDHKQRQSTKIPVYGETNQVRKGKNNRHYEDVEDDYAEGSEAIKRTAPVYSEGNMNGNVGAIPVIDTLPPPNERGTSITTNEPLYNTCTKSGETTGIAKGEDRDDKSSLTVSVNGKSMQNSIGAEKAKDDSRLLSAENEYGDVDAAEERVPQIYEEIDVDEHVSAVNVNGDVASGTGVESMPDINVPLLRQGDKNTNSMKMAKGESNFLVADDEYGEVSDTLKRITPVYAEVVEDGNTSPVHANCHRPSKAVKDTMPAKSIPVYGKVDKNTDGMKMAKGESNLLVADDEYGEVSDTLKRITPVYAEVGEDGIAAPVHAKGHVPSKPVKDTMPAKSIPVYGKVDKNTDGKKMAKGESNLLVADDEYGEVSDALKRITPVYAEVGEDGNTPSVHVTGEPTSKAV